MVSISRAAAAAYLGRRAVAVPFFLRTNMIHHQENRKQRKTSYERRRPSRQGREPHMNKARQESIWNRK